jgi:hypothetical protein
MQLDGHLFSAEADQGIGLPRNFVGRLHQLGDRVVEVADGEEGALALQSIGPFEGQLELCGDENKNLG